MSIPCDVNCWHVCYFQTRSSLSSDVSCWSSDPHQHVGQTFRSKFIWIANIQNVCLQQTTRVMWPEEWRDTTKQKNFADLKWRLEDVDERNRRNMQTVLSAIISGAGTFGPRLLNSSSLVFRFCLGSLCSYINGGSFLIIGHVTVWAVKTKSKCLREKQNKRSEVTNTTSSSHGGGGRSCGVPPMAPQHSQKDRHR